MGTLDAAISSSEWDLMVEESRKKKDIDAARQQDTQAVDSLKSSMDSEPDPSGANTVDRARQQDTQAVGSLKSSMDSTGAGNEPTQTEPRQTPDEDTDTSTARDYSEYANDPRRDARNWVPKEVQGALEQADVPDGFWKSGEAFDWINNQTSLPDVSGGVSSSQTTTFSVEDPEPTKDRDQSGESRADRAEVENARNVGMGGPHVPDRTQDSPTRSPVAGGGSYESYRPPQQGESGGGGVLSTVVGVATSLPALLAYAGIGIYYGATYMGWL